VPAAWEAQRHSDRDLAMTDLELLYVSDVEALLVALPRMPGLKNLRLSPVDCLGPRRLLGVWIDKVSD
jgi:hypothetical protein